MSTTVDLSCYAEKIIDAEDRPLFEDAVAAANAGALRAAYIMIWLSCAESLKRRFHEAHKRDREAGKYLGEIEKLEEEHKAIDKPLLEKAKEYGFISDAERLTLAHIYEKRCLYAHPYENGPSQEQLIEAATSVIELVLSKPVKLRHGFVKKLIQNLLQNPNYLDDHSNSIKKFTCDILKRVDESVFIWLLTEYWKGLEKIADDPSARKLFERGFWFSHTMLSVVMVDALNAHEWHDMLCKYPKTLMRICGNINIFGQIGELAQNSVVGYIIEESEKNPHILVFLDALKSEGLLTEQQLARFNGRIFDMKCEELIYARIRMSCLYENIIRDLKSYNFYIQNPAIQLIESSGAEQISLLSEEQQIVLGRNVLQSAEGDADLAIDFVKKIAMNDKVESWPFSFIRGIVMEAFVNEKHEIRFKTRHLKFILLITNKLEFSEQNIIINEITSLIKEGHPKANWTDKSDFEEIIKLLSNQKYSWISPLSEALVEKMNMLWPPEAT